MQLHEFRDDSSRPDPLRAQIGRLIEVVGTPKFEDEMFYLVHNALDCEHLTAFAVSDAGPADVLFAANAGNLPVARALAQKYVSQYWMMDPANAIKADMDEESHVAFSILPGDITDGSYRRDCYTSVRLRDRFTVMRRHGDQTVRLNFYRGAAGGRFEPQAVDCIMNSADLLISLLMKHAANAAPASNDGMPKVWQDRLLLLEPNMPKRETEVCAAITSGMTSEAISLNLGISVNTVLTYRKRAYARLGISCQNELLRLVLS
jgi:DNA-binding CsgD family transcriptional regulator